MKLIRLEETKKLFPHWYDKNDDSNFTKHLTIVNNQQLDLYHKLKTLDWARNIEKPIQIWKEQTEPYKYRMHFKVQIPYLKKVNIYKNPIIKDEQIINSEDSLLEDISSVEYSSDSNNYYEVVYDGECTRLIPRDNFVIEVITHDDYRWLKGFPENDYVRYDTNSVYGSTLYYRQGESFIDISLEEISYSRYLTFRVHLDDIKFIEIFKDDETILSEDFSKTITTDKIIQSNDFSHRYYDSNELEGVYEVETQQGYHFSVTHTEQDEWVYRLKLKDSDFKNNDYLSDVLNNEYDIEVTVKDKRHKCKVDKDRIYHKRYNGYDNVLGDCFDHDYSLDMIGNLFNIHRYQFYTVLHRTDAYFSRTYPTYNDRLSEDDYHYMKRIQYYIENYNHIYFPVLEFWKYYYTDSRLVNRKHMIARMNHSYFHKTGGGDDDCYIVGDVITNDEYTNIATNTTTDTTVNGNTVSYSVNKASVIQGTAIKEVRATYESTEYEWAESVIINKVFIVPGGSYRLRYGVKENTEAVTILIHGYTRDGQLIRSTEFTPSTDNSKFNNYPVDNEYDYYNLSLNMPTDTAYIEVLLQSDEGFDFKDVTFERVTVGSHEELYFNNNDGLINSCTYDLYANYYDIPSNLRLGDTERFDTLFRRSLPLTKQGVFCLSLKEDGDNKFTIKEDKNIKLVNLFGGDSGGTGRASYEKELAFIEEGYHYEVRFDTVRTKHTQPIDDAPDTLTETPTYLVTTIVEFYNNNGSLLDNDTYTYENRVDNDVTGTIQFRFTAPRNSKSAILYITSDMSFNYSNLYFNREEELTEEDLI